MAIPRTLAALTIAATATLALTTQAAGAASGAWGPYHAPGKAAKTSGTLTATGEDHADLPTADVVRIAGKVEDRTRGTSCGWAVFRITYRSGSNLPNKERWARDCSYGTPKPFSFKYRDVYQVELKVCSEAKAAKPSLNCLYAGTWKTLYLSK
ncbi:unnamed protein product [[Actinomadura] parvosata subsp. kistnae]|uniref:Secreted protein n=1 Tax=[Actinomadura] parvosata subsp. kistnae TaxID=1909395 RepID=A0A1V0AE39_9ACTN|nr:hypothetical protein [Nonomuraea sp. ATCC 55076]AQZ68490.1 hypothetical protein BKM31_49755 [Nonomuraea sp. ATCC 55076]SPL93053.1 unnamed protein product [Actinomadura parvosata subsp. kistnae]